MRRHETAALDATLSRVAAARVGGYGLIGRAARCARRRMDRGPRARAGRRSARRDRRRLLTRRGHRAREVGAEWLLELYAWQATSLVAAAMVADSRVPDLAPDNVLIAIEDGRPSGIAVRGGPITGLDGDPATDIVPDEPALARVAHATLTAHAEPLIEALIARRLRPRKALWRAAGDRVAQGFLWAAHAFDAPERSARLAALTIAPPSPMNVPLATETGEDCVPYHVRSSCCLNHRTDDPMLCPGCPLWRSRRHLNTAG